MYHDTVVCNIVQISILYSRGLPVRSTEMYEDDVRSHTRSVFTYRPGRESTRAGCSSKDSCK